MHSQIEIRRRPKVVSAEGLVITNPASCGGLPACAYDACACSSSSDVSSLGFPLVDIWICCCKKWFSLKKDPRPPLGRRGPQDWRRPTLAQQRGCTTIGDRGLNERVRDGNVCFPSPMVTRVLLRDCGFRGRRRGSPRDGKKKFNAMGTQAPSGKVLNGKRKVMNQTVRIISTG